MSAAPAVIVPKQENGTASESTQPTKPQNDRKKENFNNTNRGNNQQNRGGPGQNNKTGNKFGNNMNRGNAGDRGDRKGPNQQGNRNNEVRIFFQNGVSIEPNTLFHSYEKKIADWNVRPLKI